jgi:glycosyltransferase involved in cell wall biosynthesis
MNILHVHSGNLFGGVETTLLAQARHKDSEVDMQMSFALCFPGRFSSELRQNLAPVYGLGECRVRSPLSVRRVRQRLKDLLQEHRFDAAIVHSCWSQAIFGRTIKDAGLPLVFWLHDAARGHHWLERWAKRTTPDVVLCNSRFTAKTLPNLYPKTPSHVVCPPHSQEVAHLSESGRLAIRSELGTPADAVVIVQVGRMERWKGHRLLFQALSQLKHLPHWVCWQVGGAQRQREAGYLDTLKEMTRTLGIADRVHFLGQRSDVKSLLAAADIYCQPNTGPEPFGLTFIEALFAKLPIVTTAIGAATEIVDSSCGVLVPPNDAGSLALQLACLIESPAARNSLSEFGPSRAHRISDLSTQSRLIYQILGSLN